jgi:hypothetical protein
MICGMCHHIRDFPDEFDVPGIVAPPDGDLFDQLLQDLDGLLTGGIILKGFLKAFDLLAIDLCQVGVYSRWWRLFSCQIRLKLLFPIGQLVEPFLEIRGPETVRHGIDQSGELSGDGFQLAISVRRSYLTSASLPVEFRVISENEFLDQFRSHQMALQAVQYKVVKNGPRNSLPLVAGALSPSGATGKVMAT